MKHALFIVLFSLVGFGQLITASSISLVGLNPVRGKGKATLIGYKKMGRECRFVFLTVTHFFTGQPPEERVEEEFEITMSELKLASQEISDPIRNYNVWFHPQARLDTYDAGEYDRDIAMFRFNAPCLSVSPKPLSISSDKNGEVLIHRTDWTNADKTQLARLAALRGQVSTYNDHKTKYRLSWSRRGVAPGDSGSAILKSFDGELKIVGVLYGQLNSVDENKAPLPGLFSGGTEVMQEIQQALNAALSEDRWGIEAKAGHKLRLAKRLFFSADE